VLARRGVVSGAFARRPALAAGGAIVLGLVLWFAGLYNA
jgi:hypothetical protein